jgi:uncharacterized membrane protein YphA (DoxX/SURF4 family)
MNNRTFGILLWIVQGLLAALFLFSGAMKLYMPAQTLEQQAHMSGPFLKLIGVFEVLGAAGLILPELLKVRRELTPLAAAGLVIIMIGATVFTIRSGGGMSAAFPAVVGLFCALVAYGRRRTARTVETAAD